MLGLKWAMPQSLGQSRRRTKAQINVESSQKNPKCLKKGLVCSVCLPSPRWRTLCCRCCPGVSVYAAAGRDALLKSSGSSRDRTRKEGPDTAIVFHRNHRPAHIPRYLYWEGCTHRCAHTGTDTLHTHTCTLTSAVYLQRQ